MVNLLTFDIRPLKMVISGSLFLAQTVLTKLHSSGSMEVLLTNIQVHSTNEGVHMFLSMYIDTFCTIIELTIVNLSIYNIYSILSLYI